METVGIIAFFLIGGLIIYFIRKLIFKGVDKATDAVANAVTRKKNASNSPRAENLADQYKKQ